MQNPRINNKRIAKNIVFLYIRMIITMVVSLYTSRVVLQTLGIDDFGIYQTVGGVVAMIGYLKGALSAGTSRFLTYELGTGNKEKLLKTFSSLFYVHIIFCLVVLIIGETIGLWFVYNKLLIAPERMSAAVAAYHFSVLASICTIIQVPFNASIISHERMSVYAYASIADAVLKLLIIFLIIKSPIDKLVYYALLLCIQTACMTFFYWWYARRQFEECKLRPFFDRPIIKSVLSYSSWNVFATTAVALCSQGLTVVTNMFFLPGVVTARSVANTVNQTANQFVDSFRTAVNPQIVKQYAAGNNDGSKELLLSSTKNSFYLLYIIALPVCLCSESLLRLWLGQVPEYSVQFLQLAIITSLFGVFDLSFYTGLYATGRIKENSFFSSSAFFVCFVATYLCFKLGMSPIMSGWMLLFSQMIISLVIKPILLVKIVGYKYKEIVSVLKNCFSVVLLSAPIPFIAFYLKNNISGSYYINELVVCVVSIFSSLIGIWYVGFDKNTRNRLLSFLKSKIKK